MTTTSHNELMTELRQVTNALMSLTISKEERQTLKNRLVEINDILFAAYPED